MTKEEKQELRTLVRTMYDFQDMRIRTAGRLRLKKDDEPQDESNMPDMDIANEELPVIVDIKDDVKDIEKKLTKRIKKLVESDPLWDAFFGGVKGCGPLMAGVILTEFDIERATTVSKMWQFSGLNPGMVRGKKRQKDGDGYINVDTDVMVRGDRRSPGFVSPFNGFLRTKLVGVLAGCMIKSKSSYALDFYYPYKARLEQEENLVAGGEKAWSEESKGHRDNAAKRYMVKMFIKDLYVAWRTLEGLPVREPYQVEYLGKAHSA